MGKLGDMNKLRQQAMTMQKNLAAQTITVEENGVKVVITGDQKIISIEIQGMSNEVLNEVINKAIRKSQELAAKELMNVSGGMATPRLSSWNFRRSFQGAPGWSTTISMGQGTPLTTRYASSVKSTRASGVPCSRSSPFS